MNQNPVIKRIHDRLHKKDKNYLAFFTGQTGSGKSESSIKLGSLIDPNFSIDQIVFSVEEFFNLIKGKTDTKLKPGSCIVWEEMGVSADNLTFYSLQNRAITYCFETFRFLNLGVIMNVPGLKMIDSKVRKLGHQYYETQFINKKEKTCRCKVMDLQYNPRIDKIFFKYPRELIKGDMCTIQYMDFLKPNDDIIKPYKEKKMAFFETLSDGLQFDLAESKIDKTAKPKDVSSIVEDLVNGYEKYAKPYRGSYIFDTALITGLYDVGEPTGKKAKALAELMLIDKGIMPDKPKRKYKKRDESYWSNKKRLNEEVVYS